MGIRYNGPMLAEIVRDVRDSLVDSEVVDKGETLKYFLHGSFTVDYRERKVKFLGGFNAVGDRTNTSAWVVDKQGVLERAIGIALVKAGHNYVVTSSSTTKDLDMVAEDLTPELLQQEEAAIRGLNGVVRSVDFNI